MYWEYNITSVVILPENAWFESNHKYTPDNPKLRDILQNYWPLLLASIIQKCQSQERERKVKGLF